MKRALVALALSLFACSPSGPEASDASTQDACATCDAAPPLDAKSDAAYDAEASVDADAGPTCFVTRSGSNLSLGGSPFAFVGANLRGIAYHSSAEIDAQLQAAASLGIRVIRVFAVKNDRGAQGVGDAIANLISRAQTVAPKLTFILSLEDFYATGFSAQGDDGFYQNGLLDGAWFTGGYQQNYLPLVLALVARFHDEPRIFAWEIGNELSAGSAGAQAMLDYAYDVGWKIKNAGAKQMVTTGFIDVNHAIGGGVSDTILGQVYVGPWGSHATSPFDVGCIHAYNNEQQPGNSFGYQLQDKDIAWFMANAMPYVVGEGGFNGGKTTSCSPFTGALWDGISIPDATNDRAPATAATIDHFFAAKGADGWMQWGLMSGTDNGEGDRCSGMDTVFHADWSTLAQTFQSRAAQLPAGSASCP